jgi:hypothetical protein
MGDNEHPVKNEAATIEGPTFPPNEMTIRRILWAIQLAENIQPSNCSHAGSNIYSTLIHTMRQMANGHLPKRLQADPPVEQEKNFPMECVKHLATKSCGCQRDGLMVDRNSHWPSCMVGQAQAYLGKKVSWEINGKPCAPPK